MKLWIIPIIIIVVLIAAVVVMYFLGKKAQKKQEEQRSQLEAAKQTYTMLVIDKKRMPLKDSGVPSMVLEQTPKRYLRSKVPIVKAKVGPKIMSLIADDKIFDEIPIKKEVKAEVSGLYILNVKGLRGKTETAPVKKSWIQKLRIKASQTSSK